MKRTRLSVPYIVPVGRVFEGVSSLYPILYEKCKSLKYKVQDLIDSKVITFAPNGPNVNNNPMPPHKNSTVNMVEMDNGRRLLTCVDELKTSLLEIKNVLMKSNAFIICTRTCEHYLINP